MIISDEHKLLFVHVQKTGGVTLTNLLKSQLTDVRSNEKRHAPLRRILRKEPDLADYWIFGFVRNPWDRMVSWWSMIENWRDWSDRKGLDTEEKWNHFWRGSMEYPDFEQFVLRGTEDFPRLRKPQLEYLQTANRRADFIGRTERLSEDSRFALEHFGLSTEGLTHDNKSKRTGYRDYYNAATRAKVAEVFDKDIRAFDYEF
ncbi:sulfotransferase family 2 domain-containing protein [Nocardioides sp. R-C-SC26]|uniref:sulfotransferase family 2 domain-containing protein n=1 Tax=Nocardioides sp. R-C-SC26 TaxID=2870414 RepID=UPI001E5F372A|nr:sulfotransferase family 2 domain-containing protein [Nocardioides sp. R-C-SC26]